MPDQEPRDVYHIKLNAHKTLSDISEMSLSERGLYLTLLLHQWTTGSIPEDVSKLNITPTELIPVKETPQIQTQTLLEYFEAVKCGDGESHSEGDGKGHSKRYGESIAEASIRQWQNHGGSICLITDKKDIMSSLRHLFVPAGPGRLKLAWLDALRKKAQNYSTGQSVRGQKGAEVRWQKHGERHSEGDSKGDGKGHSKGHGEGYGKRNGDANGVAMANIIIIILDFIHNNTQTITQTEEGQFSENLAKIPSGPEVTIPALGGTIRLLFDHENKWWTKEIGTFLTSHNWATFVKSNSVSSLPWFAGVLKLFIQHLMDGSDRDSSGKISNHFRNWFKKNLNTPLFNDIGKEVEQGSNGQPDPKVRGTRFIDANTVELSDGTQQILGPTQLYRKEQNELKPATIIKNLIE